MSGSDEQHTNTTRRKFIAGALAATALSAAGGGALALRNRPTVVPQEIVLASQTAPPAAAPAVASGAQSDLLAKLAAAQAENVKLQSQVDSLTRRLEAAESGRSEVNGEVNVLQDELTQAQEKAGILAGLVTLYDQLEEVDLSDTVMSGLTVLARQFGELGENLPGLDDALAAGEVAIASFEGDIPALESGRAWFSEHVSQLSWSWQILEGILREVLETLGGGLELLQQWFDKLLGWVPFEFGEKARRAMSALFDLVYLTPQTVAQGQSELLGVMDQWLKPEVGQREPAVRTKLVQPLREGVLGKAAKTSQQIKDANKTFQVELVSKTAANIADRSEIEQLIRQYRTEHKL
ncbi:MAG: hypothetical protein QNJ45_11845 [Ardenticatenaceae bacterium]|nr:hypothetical protein [Ardenticatenaceae bacterium]